MRNRAEENTTDVVLNAWSKNPGTRFKEIVDAMITHLHEFVREVQLTEAEWGAAIKHLHACAHRGCRI
jgi:hydroxyquinol 1,2-dioxygenase